MADWCGAGCLIGQDDANQALQADINADPSGRLQAATLYPDSSNWLARVHSWHSTQPRNVLQDALGQEPTLSPARDGLLEVQDAGLEGGQEGVMAEGGTHVKPEGAGDGDRQAGEEERSRDAGTLTCKPEASGQASEEAEPGVQGEAGRPSVAIFGEEIAAEEQVSLMDSVPGKSAWPAVGGIDTELVVFDDPVGEAAASSEQRHSDSPQLDESMELSGESATAGSPGHDTAEPSPANQQTPAVQTYIVLCRDNGWLQIFALPEMELVFHCRKVAEGPPLLTHGGSSPPGDAGEEDVGVQIVEACMESFGPSNAAGWQGYPARPSRPSSPARPPMALPPPNPQAFSRLKPKEKLRVTIKYSLWFLSGKPSRKRTCQSRLTELLQTCHTAEDQGDRASQ